MQDFTKVISRMDIFGAPLPTFNLAGKTIVKTATGGIISFIVFVVFFVYGTLKLTHLINKYNPQISEIEETNFYDMYTRLDLTAINFNIAFAVEGYIDGQIKNDHRYVKYMTRILTKQDGIETETVIPFGFCTVEQLSRFSEPAKGVQEKLDAILNDPNRNLYCMDDEAMKGVEIYGDENNVEHQRIEMLLLPCNYLHTDTGYTGDSIHPECIDDLEQQKQYLGALDWKVYYTQEMFVPDGFASETIAKNSYMFNQQADINNPNFVRTKININEVADESQTLQLGFAEEIEFHKFSVDAARSSSWNKFPTRENPSTRYKYSSVEIILDPDKLVVNRQTYSLLDWLGDMGGLFDALRYLCMAVIHPVAQFTLQSTLMSTMFLFQPITGDNEDKEQGTAKKESLVRALKSKQRLEGLKLQEKNYGKSKSKLLDTITKEFLVIEQMKKVSFYIVNLFCDRTYKKKMLKSKHKLEKELDLRKFIHRQRVYTTAVIGLLTGSQSLFVNKMAQMVVRESSDTNTSADDELDDMQKTDTLYVKKMMLSKGKVDNRLINLYKLRKADKTGDFIEIDDLKAELLNQPEQEPDDQSSNSYNGENRHANFSGQTRRNQTRQKNSAVFKRRVEKDPIMDNSQPRKQFKTTQQRLRQNSFTTLRGDNSMIELQRTPSQMDDSPLYLKANGRLSSDLEGLDPHVINSYQLPQQQQQRRDTLASRLINDNHQPNMTELEKFHQQRLAALVKEKQKIEGNNLRSPSRLKVNQRNYQSTQQVNAPSMHIDLPSVGFREQTEENKAEHIRKDIDDIFD